MKYRKFTLRTWVKNRKHDCQKYGSDKELILHFYGTFMSNQGLIQYARLILISEAIIDIINIYLYIAIDKLCYYYDKLSMNMPKFKIKSNQK